MSTFLTMFDTSNYLAKDELVATMMRQLIKHPKSGLKSVNVLITNVINKMLNTHRLILVLTVVAKTSKECPQDA